MSQDKTEKKRKEKEFCVARRQPLGWSKGLGYAQRLASTQNLSSFTFILFSFVPRLSYKSLILSIYIGHSALDKENIKMNVIGTYVHQFLVSLTFLAQDHHEVHSVCA
jgi:hypothetical protein